MQVFQSDSNLSLRLDNYFYNFRKYRILEILNSYPADQSKELKRQLPLKLDINRQTFANWLNSSKADKLEIPSIKLWMISKFLKVSIDELFNIDESELIFHNLFNEESKSILQKAGLTI